MALHACSGHFPTNRAHTRQPPPPDRSTARFPGTRRWIRAAAPCCAASWAPTRDATQPWATARCAGMRSKCSRNAVDERAGAWALLPHGSLLAAAKGGPPLPSSPLLPLSRSLVCPIPSASP